MRSRKPILGAVLAFIALPAVLALAEAVSYRTHNRANRSILSSGQEREYELFVPASYDRSKPTPLVISLHGAGLWGVAQMEISQWNRIAEREGFVVVYPSGSSEGGPRTWEATSGSTPGKDVRFIADLIDTLKTNYNIDPARIYANGLSNGGGMTFVLSCMLSDRIAAVGMVGAAQLLPWSWCRDQRPVPMIAFHGTGDLATPYHGGSSWVAPIPFPNIPAWTANWARRNHCGATPVDLRVAADVTRREYPNCAGAAQVVFYTIKGGGHTWPGGGPLPEWALGPISQSIDASALMWEFFRNHPLRRE